MLSLTFTYCEHTVSVISSFVVHSRMPCERLRMTLLRKVINLIFGCVGDQPRSQGFHDRGLLRLLLTELSP